jgi:hypothetical protein
VSGREFVAAVVVTVVAAGILAVARILWARWDRQSQLAHMRTETLDGSIRPATVFKDNSATYLGLDRGNPATGEDLRGPS